MSIYLYLELFIYSSKYLYLEIFIYLELFISYLMSLKNPEFAKNCHALDSEMLQPNLKLFLHKSAVLLEFLIPFITPCRPAVLGAFVLSLQLWAISHQLTSNWADTRGELSTFVLSPPQKILPDLLGKGKSPLDQ